jgi:hypothetical protein
MPTEPTITIVRDSAGRELNCHLEQRLQIDGTDYGLLTPVDVPVVLASVDDDGVACEVDDPYAAEPILRAADAELEGFDLALIRSAGMLTVRGELGEADEADEPDEPDEGSYELLISLDANGERFGLYIPVDPLIVVARLHGETATLVEGEEFERVSQELGEPAAPASDAPPPATLRISLRLSPMLRVRIWLATALVRLASRLVVVGLRVEPRP